MSEREHLIMDEAGMKRAIVRLAHEIEEKSEGLDRVVLVGVKRGGEIVARRIAAYFSSLGENVPCAGLDIGMTRDDLVSAFFVPETEKNRLGFSLDRKTVILCDDVLHTGRSAAAGVEALFRLGRPSAVRLLVLADRGGKEVPVRADFVGKNVPTSRREYVRVRFRELGEETDALSIIGGDQ